MKDDLATVFDSALDARMKEARENAAQAVLAQTDVARMTLGAFVTAAKEKVELWAVLEGLTLHEVAQRILVDAVEPGASEPNDSWRRNLASFVATTGDWFSSTEAAAACGLSPRSSALRRELSRMEAAGVLQSNARARRHRRYRPAKVAHTEDSDAH